MPLTPEQRQQLEEAAQREGVDPAELIAEAERQLETQSSEGPPGNGGGRKLPPGQDGRPIAERMLVGFLPFVTVKEFREKWLGLTERIADDDMITGDFLRVHGQVAAGGEGDE